MTSKEAEQTVVRLVVAVHTLKDDFVGNEFASKLRRSNLAPVDLQVAGIGRLAVHVARSNRRN